MILQFVPRGGAALTKLSDWHETELRIGSGQNTLFSGPSGSGKTTLMRGLAGLWPLKRGCRAAPDRKISLYLPQRPYFPFNSTFRDALWYPKDPPLSDTAMAKEEDLLRQIGLSHCVEHLRNGRLADWCKELSTGEQKRLSLVRAILNEPRWLFLDEPFAGVDEASRLKCSALLQMALPSTTIICWEHEPHRNGIQFKHHIRHDTHKFTATFQRGVCPGKA